MLEMGLIFLVKILEKCHHGRGLELVMVQGASLVTGEGRGSILKVVLLFDYQIQLFSFVKILKMID